jgi:hypothetical protein
MGQKKIILKLTWKSELREAMKKVWINKFYVDNPDLEGWCNNTSYYIKNGLLHLIMTHDSDAEVIEVLKAFLNAFCIKKDEIASIDICTDVCLDYLEKKQWLSSDASCGCITDCSYFANLDAIYEESKNNE